MLSRCYYDAGDKPEIAAIPKITESFVYCLFEHYPFSPYAILVWPSVDAIVFRYYTEIPEDTSKPHKYLRGYTGALIEPSLDMMVELASRGGADLISALGLYCCNNQKISKLIMSSDDGYKNYFAGMILGSLYEP